MVAIKVHKAWSELPRKEITLSGLIWIVIEEKKIVDHVVIMIVIIQRSFKSRCRLRDLDPSKPTSYCT